MHWRQCSHHIETSQSICIVTQLTGACMTVILNFSKLSQWKNIFVQILKEDIRTVPTYVVVGFLLLTFNRHLRICNQQFTVDKLLFEVDKDTVTKLFEFFMSIRCVRLNLNYALILYQTSCKDILRIICDDLRDLVTFVQFKNFEKHSWRSVTFRACSYGGVLLLVVKLQASVCNFNKSNTPPRVFFTFFQLYKWYQIAQSVYDKIFRESEELHNLFCTEAAVWMRFISPWKGSNVYWRKWIQLIWFTTYWNVIYNYLSEYIGPFSS